MDTPTIKNIISAETRERACGIKLLALDVDGVLSDGKLYYGNNGEELKSFSILDGLGIKLLQDQGIIVAIITGRESNIVSRRARELSIQHVVQGREDKITALHELLKQTGFTLEQTAYMGDDLPDLSAIIQCRFGTTVANGHDVVKQHADWISTKSGGAGA
ncbi:MAG: HAD-IIIA family hydrolase, partial [Sinobacterium sp.]